MHGLRAGDDISIMALQAGLVTKPEQIEDIRRVGLRLCLREHIGRWIYTDYFVGAF